jgi:transposase
MPRVRRSFTPEYRVEAAHRVIDGHRCVADVACELGLQKNLLYTWVRDERWRMSGAILGHQPYPHGGQSLSPDECAELVRLRAQVAQQAEDIASLERAFAYVAAQLNCPGFRAHFLSWKGWHDDEQA